MRKCFWYGSAAIAALLTTTAAQAGTLWIAIMNNANEPGTVARSTATGITSLILNDAETSATVRATHNEAAVNPSPVTLGHIHRGPAGVAGPVIFPYPNPNSPIGPLVWAIPAADVVNLKNAGLYSNIHTQQNPGGDIRGQFFRALLAPSATNDTQLTVARMLDISAGFDTDLDLALIAANTTSGSKAAVLDDLSGSSVYIQTHEAMEALGDFSSVAMAQARAHRGLGATGDSGFSVFAQAGADFGTRKAEDGEVGGKISRPYFMGGVNYAFDNMNAGLALGYADGKNTLKNSLGSTKGKTFGVEAYVSSDFGGSPIVADATLGFGWTSYDIVRQIPSFGRTGTASTKGTSVGGAIKVAVPLKAGEDFEVSPYVQLDMTSAKVNAYTETGAGSLGLSVDQQRVTNGFSEIGVSLGSDKPGEGSIAPHVEVGWRHVLDNGKGSFGTKLIGAPGNFSTPSLPVKDGVALGAQIATRLSGGMEINLDYRGLIDKKLSAHAITAGIRFRF